MRSGDCGPMNDFDRWMIMAPRFVHGGASYVDDNLPTPPITLLVFGPFSALPRPAAQFLWACVKLPLAAAVFVLAALIATRAGVRFSTSALLLVFAGWWLAVVVDMQEGQVNFLALLPLVAALFVAQDEGVLADVWAGALIGLAAAVKVTPIVFAVYFLWKRRWIVALASIGGFAAATFIVPALVFGWTRNLRWLHDWTAIMIVPYVTSGTVVYATTQSIGSFARRLLTATPAFEIHRNGVWEYGYMNVASLGAEAVRRIVRGAMVAVGIAGLVWAWRPLASRRSPRYVVEIGAVAAFMLWFSERTWVHHYVSFILTLAAAGMIVSDERVVPRARRFASGALVVFAVATVFASDAGRVLGPHGVEWAKAVGVYLWPSVLVAFATVRAGG